jgi:murein DD-endopeptidase MepM/ murein hydrolase activator NlpD
MAKKKTGNTFLGTQTNKSYSSQAKKRKEEVTKKASSSSNVGKNTKKTTTTIKKNTTNNNTKKTTNTKAVAQANNVSARLSDKYGNNNRTNNQKAQANNNTARTNLKAQDRQSELENKTKLKSGQLPDSTKSTSRLDTAVKKNKETDASKPSDSVVENINSRLEKKYSGKTEQNKFDQITTGAMQQVVGGYMKAFGDVTNEVDLQRERLKAKHDSGEITDKVYKKELDALNRSGKAKMYDENKKLAENKTGVRGKVMGTMDDVADWLMEKGTEINDKGNTNVSMDASLVDKNGEPVYSNFERIAGSAWTSAIGMASDMALGPAWMAGMLTRTYGNELGTRETIDDEGNVWVSKDQDRMNASLQALKEVGTEKIFSGLKAPSALFGKNKATGFAERALDSAVNKISNKTARNVTYTIGKRILAAGEEGSEEILAGLLDPVIANVTYANELAEKTGKEEYRESVSAADIVEAVASAGLMTAVLGVPGTINAVANKGKASEVAEKAYGEEAKKKKISTEQALAQAAMGVDDEVMATRASAMYDRLSKGGNALADEQVMELVDALVPQASKVQDEVLTARFVAFKQAQEEGNVITPYSLAPNEKGELTFVEGPTNDAYQKSKENALKVGKVMELENGFSKDRQEETAMSIAAIDVGLGSIGDVQGFYVNMPEARTVYNRNHSKQLPVVKYRDGSVNPTATNIATREFLMTTMIENYKTRAAEETIKHVDEQSAVVNNELTRNIGAEGRAKYEELAGELSVFKGGEYLLATKAFQDAYRAGEVGLSYETFKKEDNPAHKVLSEEMLEEAYISGLMDAEELTYKYIERGEKISQIKDLGHSKGIIDTNTYMTDQTLLPESDREFYSKLAAEFGVSFVFHDGTKENDPMARIVKDEKGNPIKDENGKIKHVKDNEGDFLLENGFYVNGVIHLNARIKSYNTAMNLTYKHEITHHVARYAPAEYKILVDMVKKRYAEKYGVGALDRMIAKVMQDYKDAGVKEFTKEDALEEIVADAARSLDDKVFVKEAEQNVSFAQKIINAIRNIIAKIRIVLARERTTRDQNQSLLEALDIMKEFEEKYVAALSKAYENRGKIGLVSGSDKYSMSGNGYDGYSMSNNARDAYAHGEKPLSKWTKADIVSEIEEIRPDLVDVLKKIPLNTLKNELLYKSSWHHTSSMYNRTNFYSLDESKLESLTEENISNWDTSKPAQDVVKYKGKIEYIEWTGSRNHPKANKKVLDNVNIEERGSFYYVTDEDGNEILKKKIGSNGTHVTDYEAEQRRKEAERQKLEEYALNSSEEAMAFLGVLEEEGFQRSNSGHIYPRGRKPSVADYNNLSEFFRVGEQRLVDNWASNSYTLETWNGSEWVAEDKKHSISWSEERIDDLIDRFGATNESYSQAYATSIDPKDFLKLTLRDELKARWEEAGEVRPLDRDRLKNETQTPYLQIYSSEGFEVFGHEGRHRMSALADEGYTSVPIVVLDYDTKYSKKDEESMTLTSQDNGDGPINNNASVTLENLIPIKESNRDRLIAEYGGEADFKYSVASETITDADDFVIENMGVGAKFSIATFNNNMPKFGNFSKSDGFASIGEVISGKELLFRTLTQRKVNPIDEKVARRVVSFLSTTADKLSQEALHAEYRYINWDNLDSEVKVRMDKDGNILSIIGSAMVANGEYAVNFDFTTICNKREGMMEVIKELAKAQTEDGKSYLDEITLSRDNIWKMNLALKDHGVDTACLGCFVEARRYNTENFVKKIDSVWNEAVKKRRKELGLPEEEYFDFSTKEPNDADVGEAVALWEAYEDDKTEGGKKSAPKRIETLLKQADKDSGYLKLIKPSDILTPEGIAGLEKISVGKGKQNGKKIDKPHSLVKTLKSIYGTAAPKEILAFTPYNSEILLLPEKSGDLTFEDYLKSIGGARIQSFSDYKIENVFDYMQMVADLAARHFTAHAYTKVIDFARIFGKTGIKINLSVMFDVHSSEEWANMLGCDEAKAQAIAKKYAGLTFVETIPEEDTQRAKDKKKTRPYKKVKNFEGTGKDGYLVYLVGDDHRAEVFYENAKKAILEGGKYSEEEAEMMARGAMPFSQSINYNDAAELQNEDGYKENVGIIAVGYSDEHIKMLLEDDNVRYIIPYHKSGLPTEISKATNLGNARSYEDLQNTIKIPRGYVIDKGGNRKVFNSLYKNYKKEHADDKLVAIHFIDEYINSGMYSTRLPKAEEGTEDKKVKGTLPGTGNFDVYEALDNHINEKFDGVMAVAEEYAEYCVENNMLPIFFNHIGSKGYYKFLFDFAVTDEEGNIHPQHAVSNNYPGVDVDQVAQERDFEESDFEELSEAMRHALEMQNEKNRNFAENKGSILEALTTKGNTRSIVDDTNLKPLLYNSPDYTNPKNPAEIPRKLSPVTMAEDQMYMDAARSGDMEAAQRMVDDVAQRKGLVHTYHGTEGFGFTKIDFTKSDDGISFFSTDNINVARSYSRTSGVRGLTEKRGENPNYEDEVEEAKQVLRDSCQDYADSLCRLAEVRSWIDAKTIDDTIETCIEFGQDIYEAIEDFAAEAFYASHENKTGMEFADYQYSAEADKINEMIERVTQDAQVYGEVGYMGGDMDSQGNMSLYIDTTNFLHVDAKGKGWRGLGHEYKGKTYHKTREVARLAKEQGYDGVWFENIYDTGTYGGSNTPSSNVYISFNATSIKSADPVTYDDEGNVIPLSERFNPENDDIRWSRVDAVGNTLTEAQERYFSESKARNEDGLLVPVYHTTSNGGFTKFDPKFSDDNRSLFFASNEAVSRTYASGSATDINETLAGNDKKCIIESLVIWDSLEEDGLYLWTVSGKVLKDDKWVDFTEIGEDEPVNEHGWSEFENLERVIEEYIGNDRTFLEFSDEEFTNLDYIQHWFFDVMDDVGEAASGKNLLDYGLELINPTTTNIYPCYLNLKNPLIIDAKGESWRHIMVDIDDPENPNSDSFLYLPKEASVILECVDLNHIWDFDRESKDEDYRHSEIILKGRKKNEIGEWEEFSVKSENAGDEVEVAHAIIRNASTKLGISLEWFDKIPLLLLQDNGEIHKNVINVYDEKGEALEQYRKNHNENGYIRVSDGGIDTREAAFIAEKRGYDGVIIKNLHDLGGFLSLDEVLSDEEALSDIYIAFNSEQVKLISNQNPTEDPDIRFSKADIQSTTEWVEDMMNAADETFETEDDTLNQLRQNRADFLNEVRAQAEAIAKDPTKLTKGKILDEKKVGRDVQKLLEYAMQNSMYRGKYKNNVKKDVIAALKVMYKQMADEDWMGAGDTVTNISSYIVDSIELTNDIDFDNARDFRNYMRNSRLRVGDDLKSDIDWSYYRRKNFGRISFDQNGANVDTIWEDIKPYLRVLIGREVEDIDHQADMLLAIDMGLDATRPVAVVRTSEETTQLMSEVASDLWDICYEADSWKSFADRKKAEYDEKTKKLKERQKEAIRELRNEKNEIIEELKKENNSLQSYLRRQTKKTERAIEALEDYKQKVKDSKEKKKIFQERAKRYKSVEKNYARLAKMLLEPDTKQMKLIPEQFRQSVAEILVRLDFQTDRSKKLEAKYGKVSQAQQKQRSLKETIREIAESGESYDIFSDNAYSEYIVNLSDYVEKFLDNLDSSDVYGYDMEALDHLNDLMATLVHSFNNYNQTFADEKRRKIGDIGNKIQEEAAESVKLNGKRKTYGGLRGAVDSLTAESMETPIDFFENMGEAWTDVYLELRRGLNKHTLNMNDLRIYFEKVFREYFNTKGPGSSIENWREDYQEFTLKDGNVITLTPAHIMSLYCHSRREQSMGHILVGGVTVSDIKQKSNAIAHILGAEISTQSQSTMITQADIDMLIGTLTEEQKKIADKLQALLNNEVQKWGNDTSMQLYGIRLFREKSYFPIAVSRMEIDSKVDDAVPEPAEKIRNFGFTKPLKPHAGQALVLDDIFSVVCDHCNKMSLYNAYSAAIADFQRVFNYREKNDEGMITVNVKGATSNAYGQQAISYIMKLMADINGSTATYKTGAEQVMDTMLANYKKAAIGFNPRVAVQQPMSIIRALMVLDIKWFRKGGLATHKDRRRMLEHCPIAMWKSWGNYQNDYARNLEDIMFNRDWSKLDAITMAPYGYLDDMTWACIYKAIEAETQENHPEVAIESEEYWKIVNDRMDYVIDHTQVVDSVFHRSAIMRSKDRLSKLFSSFMAEPTRTWNMLRSAIVQSKKLNAKGEKDQAVKLLSKGLAVYTLSAFGTSLAAAIIDMFRDDDDDQTWLQKFFEHLWDNFIDNINPLNMLFLVKDFSNIAQNIIEGNYFSNSNMITDGVKKSVQAIADIIKKANGTSDKSIWDIAYETADGLGSLSGIPGKNAMRVFENVTRILIPESSADDGSDDEALVTKFLSNIGLGNSNSGSSESGEISVKSLVAQAEKASKGKKGSAKKDALWDAVNDGYTNDITSGNMSNIDKRRKAYVQAGGNKEDFNERISSRLKTEYKKCIGDADDLEKLHKINAELTKCGYDDEDISEIARGSNVAQKCKAAMMLRDDDEVKKWIWYLAEAGLTQEDLDYLWEKRATGTSEVKTKYLKKLTGKSSNGYIWPTTGTISSGFGYRTAPIAGASTYHEGVDIAASRGTTVSSAKDGTVISAGYVSGFGYQVVVDHGDGDVTYYSHLYSYNVLPGDYVSQGQKIGGVGSTGTSTGNHLDFRVQRNGEYIDPLTLLN